MDEKGQRGMVRLLGADRKVSITRISAHDNCAENK